MGLLCCSSHPTSLFPPGALVVPVPSTLNALISDHRMACSSPKWCQLLRESPVSSLSEIASQLYPAPASSLPSGITANWHGILFYVFRSRFSVSLEGNSLICQGWLPPKSRISKEGREIFYCFIQFWFTFYKPKLLYHKLTYYFKRNRWWMFVGGVCGRGREVKVKAGDNQGRRKPSANMGHSTACGLEHARLMKQTFYLLSSDHRKGAILR